MIEGLSQTLGGSIPSTSLRTGLSSRSIAEAHRKEWIGLVSGTSERLGGIPTRSGGTR
jgi:hypothetical protein